MPPPLSLQRCANDIVNGTYNETSKLWAACQAKDTELAKEFSKASANGRLDGRMRDALRRVHDSLRKGANNSNNRGHRSAPAGKAARPVKTTGQPPLSELRLLDADTLLVDENGNPVPQYDAEQLSCDSVGVTFTSERKVADAIIMYMNVDVFSDTCSMVCKSALMEKATSAQKKEIVTC